MTNTLKTKKKIVISACVAAFFGVFLIFCPYANATWEYFDDYSLGAISGQGNWSATGTVSGLVNTDLYISEPNSLKFNSDGNLSVDYVQLTVDDALDYTEYWYMRMNFVSGGSNTACVSFLNASSTIFSWFCAEPGGNMSVNGSDAQRNYIDGWNLITFEISTTSARIKIEQGSFSNWKAYGITPKHTDYMRFSTDDVGYTTYIDNLQNYNPYSDTDILIDFNYWGELAGYPSLEFYPGFSCWSGITCEYPIVANQEAVGNTVYIIEQTSKSDTTGCTPENAFETIEIMPPDLYDQGQPVVLPDYASGTIKYFCFYYEDFINGDQLYAGMDVMWLDFKDIQDYSEYVALLAEYHFDDPCYGIATSTGDFWDDFRYGLECGGRKLISWAIIPSETSRYMISDQLDIMKRQFPLNIFFDIQYQLLKGGESVEYDHLEINVAGTHIGYFFSTSTIETVQNYDVYIFYWTIMKTFIYLFGVIFALFILIKL